MSHTDQKKTKKKTNSAVKPLWATQIDPDDDSWMISCRYCPQKFPGAIYDDQPSDCCYRCYDHKINKYPQLLKRLKGLVKSDQVLSTLMVIDTLVTEKLIRVTKKHE